METFGKQPRLLGNSGAAFVPNPLIYGPCRPSRLNNYVAYKSARRSGSCLRFLDIENPTAPHHPKFKQIETTGLPRKLTQKEKVTGQANQTGPTKRKARATGKRTGGRPIHKLKTSGMRLQTDIPAGTSKEDTNIQQPAPSYSDNDDQSSVSSEDIALSLERQIQKRTPPAIPTAPLRKSTRNRQSALSTAFGNPVPINVIQNKNWWRKEDATIWNWFATGQTKYRQLPEPKITHSRNGFHREDSTIQSMCKIDWSD